MMSEMQPPASGGQETHILHVCPLCQAAYNPLKTQVLAERDDEHLLFLECRQCGTGVMAIVSAGPNGLAITGTLTDLTLNEVFGAFDRRPVAEDDVIELHLWLAGDERLFKALR